MEKILSREEIGKRLDFEKIRQNTVDLKTILAEKLKNQEFKEAYQTECLRYEIAEKIRQTRENKHLTQTELAKLAETTQKIISKIEHGKVSIGLDLLQKITNALELRIIIT